MQLPEIRENAENAEAEDRHRRRRARPGCPAAYFLARLGYRPVVFEAEPQAGGMLVQAIPAYRLPREIVAREVRMIEHMGVELRDGKALGEDFTLKSLQGRGLRGRVRGRRRPAGRRHGHARAKTARASTDALSFLSEYNLRGSVPVGKNVVVIGGGNSAIDAARTALRLGAESVTVVYRRSRGRDAGLGRGDRRGRARGRRAS